MTKSIAISSLVLGLVVFVASIGYITQPTKSIKNDNIINVDEVTTVSESTAVHSFNNPKPIAKKSLNKTDTNRRYSEKRSNMTVSYNHILEQGGSPNAKTVRVTEYL